MVNFEFCVLNTNTLLVKCLKFHSRVSNQPNIEVFSDEIKLPTPEQETIQFVVVSNGSNSAGTQVCSFYIDTAIDSKIKADNVQVTLLPNYCTPFHNYGLALASLAIALVVNFT